MVLGEAGGLADTKAGWRRYVQYLQFLATDAMARRELVARRMSRGWCVGTREFKREQQQQAARRGADLERMRFAGLEAGELQQERQALWEERLQQLAVALKVDLTRLGPKKSQPEKVALVAALKQSTSVSNGWLARRLDMGQGASARQFGRRYLQNASNRATLERLLSRVKT